MEPDPRVLLKTAEKSVKTAEGAYLSKRDKWSTAGEDYALAGNAFRVAGQYNEAGVALETAAEIQIDPKKANDSTSAALNYQEASKVYRKVNPQKAIDCLRFTVRLFNISSGARRAGGQQESLAEIVEMELGDMAAALKEYETAAALFDDDGKATALANKNWLKVAELSALESDYHKATDAFEKVATSAVSNNLLRWSVKEYFLKAGLCHLANGDMVATNRALAKYRDMDPTFTSTREHQLLVDLLETVEAGDQEAFADKLFNYDQLSKLDKWKTTILLRIKNSIEEQGEDFS